MTTRFSYVSQVLVDLAVVDANVDTIMAVTDEIPDAGTMASIAQESTLEDVEDHLAYAVHHEHNVGRWWGATGAPTETNAIAATVTVPFVAVSGNDDWGVAIPICGTADNPVLVAATEFDAHGVLITDMDDDTSIWRLRIIYGVGTSGDAITAGQWTEVPAITATLPGNRAGGVGVNVRMIPVPCATKLWVQAWNDTNAEELSFLWHAHGYPAPEFP